MSQLTRDQLIELNARISVLLTLHGIQDVNCCIAEDDLLGEASYEVLIQHLEERLARLERHGGNETALVMPPPNICSVKHGPLKDANLHWLAMHITDQQRKGVQEKGWFDLHRAFNMSAEALDQVLAYLGEASDLVITSTILCIGREKLGGDFDNFCKIIKKSGFELEANSLVNKCA
ncbi:unnamed protein product [Owenia fusiformis]|uniref:Uncharacterized protein n=1 Tax=Owenia fusiformis TaxID=6347 RepID=A0A8J1UP91_OWEFU|nr:unnamed protein product [Owenia fusiformis]